MRHLLAMIMLCFATLVIGCQGGGLPANEEAALEIVQGQKGKDVVIVFYSKSEHFGYVRDRKLRRIIRKSNYKLFFVDTDTRNGKDIAGQAGVTQVPSAIKVRVSQDGETEVIDTLTDIEYLKIQQFFGN